MILKKGMTGEIDLMGPAKDVSKEILSIPSYNQSSDELFSEEKMVLKNPEQWIWTHNRWK